MFCTIQSIETVVCIYIVSEYPYMCGSERWNILSASVCGRIVGNSVPRAGTEWEAGRTSEWFWELHQTLISLKANLEAGNSDPVLSMSQVDLPSLLLLRASQGVFSKPRF